MLRLGVRSRYVVCDGLEKCLDALGSVRDVCYVAATSRVRSRRGSTSRPSCLIDSAAASRHADIDVIQKENRRGLSSTSAAVNETRKTCLYDLHVDKQGEYTLVDANYFDIRSGNPRSESSRCYKLIFSQKCSK